MTYDLAIIGGGPAGYTAAELAGKNGLKTILFEKNALGGVCLNEGCIPTKTLLYSAKVHHTAKDSAKYGIVCENVSCDLSKIIARKNKVVRKLVAGIKAKMVEAGVEVVQGVASQVPNGTGIQILCNEQTYNAKKLILCTGSETVVPPIPGLKDTAFWTSREALDNKEIPESLLIIGGGVIGIEFASFFNTLGTKVIVVEMMDEILGGMDKELSELLRNDLTKKGIEFHLSTKVISVNHHQVEIEKDGERQLLNTAQILLSVGRRPLIPGLKVNEFMQTDHPCVYACGDVTGFSLLAHTAVREAEVAVHHILGKNDPMSYKAIPGVVYTYPEIAGVGKTEEVLQKDGIPYTVKKLPMAYSGRFVAENEQGNGVCKIIEGKDGTILGVHILGNPASEIIVIAGIAIEKGMTTEELKTMVFPHPTVGEIIKETL
ncbi:MAG: Dihydrolipoyl dehydrogenase [Candidatus Ordinivivax streblomastigis]|uniref:Dihydrolipoyl dehydrogenase n=1 Tax=Candidatus Ordinivivax streblomastigis TaxID=2540710 RepID=A0A5M8NZE3_9BACT|nr:MAG: Dihydrolipoyl dehydrogenase [Candidatus Ordinivivax streblomastigis]